MSKFMRVSIIVFILSGLKYFPSKQLIFLSLSNLLENISLIYSFFNVGKNSCISNSALYIFSFFSNNFSVISNSYVLNFLKVICWLSYNLLLLYLVYFI